MYIGLFCEFYFMCIGLFRYTYVSGYTGKWMSLVCSSVFVYIGLFLGLFLVHRSLFIYIRLFLYTSASFHIHSSFFVQVVLFPYT